MCKVEHNILLTLQMGASCYNSVTEALTFSSSGASSAKIMALAKRPLHKIAYPVCISTSLPIPLHFTSLPAHLHFTNLHPTSLLIITHCSMSLPAHLDCRILYILHTFVYVCLSYVHSSTTMAPLPG